MNLSTKNSHRDKINLKHNQEVVHLLLLLWAMIVQVSLRRTHTRLTVTYYNNIIKLCLHSSFKLR